MAIRSRVRVVAMLVLAVAAVIGVRGQGGSPAPILVVVNDAAPNPFGSYLPEILRAEGINTFAVVQLADLDAPTLDAAPLTLLAETPLTAPQATLFADYVTGGGRLVAMRPDPQLAGVLGIAPAAGTTTDGYALVNQSGPGAGLQNVTLPFKGQADLYDLAGATSVAELYTTRTLSASRPAVVRHGRTAAWSFDLARSTAYARQGDPAYAGLDRDGVPGPPDYRTGDVFFETIDLERMSIPHADVHMRLLSRVIGDLLADGQPLPRLWYFPGTSRTLLVATSDSHTSTPEPYQALVQAVEAAGGHISLYLSRFLDLSASPVADWVADGHEVGLHPFFATDGFEGDFLQGYTQALDWFTNSVPVPPGPTSRHHTLEWAGWIDPVSTMATFGVRMDLSYYTWGPAVYRTGVADQAHGYINGSGLPMRFVSQTGQVLPVYQQVTALVDEQLVVGDHSQGLSPAQALAVSRELIDNSQAGGYSAIATQFHTDYYAFGEVQPWVDGTLAYATGLQVPIWTAERWLRFVEARTSTTIDDIAWAPGTGQLTFAVAVPEGAEPQSVMLPQTFGGSLLAHLTLDGQTMAPASVGVNGRSLQFVEVAPLPGGAARQVVATYATPGTLPAIAISDASVAEGDAGTTPVELTVSLSAASATDVTVSYATSDGSATAGADYQAASGTLTILAGATSVPLPLTVLGDTADEPDETFVVTLSNAVGAAISDGVGIVTILDDEADPLSWTHTTAADFGTCAVPTGTRVGSTGDVRLPGVFRDGFDAATLDARWLSGSWVGPAYTPVLSGGVMSLGNTDGAWVRSADPVPATTLDVRARFTAAPFESIGLADDTFFTRFALFSTLDDGATLWARTDPGTGEIRTSLGPVPSGFHDFAIERIAQGATELIRYSIDGVVVAAHPVPSGELPPGRYVYFSHDGGATPTLDVEHVDAAPAFESSPGTFVGCTVDALSVMDWDHLAWEASVPAGTSLAVRTRTSLDASTWSAWSDPLGASGAAITSPAGRYLQYRLELATTDPASGPVVHSVTAAAAGAAPPVVSIGNATAAENAGTATFTVSLSWPSAQTVTVNYATANGTATAGADYTAASGLVTFTAGVVSQPVVIAVLDDGLDEGDETFTVTLSSPSNATLGAAVGTGTIVDDDAPPVAAGDAYTTPFGTPLSVAAPGVLANDDANGAASMTAALVTDVAHGTLSLGSNGSLLYTPAAGFTGIDTFTYRAVSPAGNSNVATVTITVSAPTTVQPPQELRVSAMAGNLVTFRWKAGPGPAPTGYLLEGGVLPSQTLAVIGTGHAFPIFDLGAPTGSFYVRMRALGAGGPSAPSNEIRIHVGVPVPPSAPSAFQATTSGNTLHMAWRPTFEGAAPTGVVLDVTGSLAASLPLAAAERVSFSGVPAGTYTLSVRATNAGGGSASSPPVTVTVPDTCATAPEAPVNLLAYSVGGTATVVWDPPPTGAAPTSYLLTVPGVANIPMTTRSIRGALPAGAYPIEVRAIGACGTSVAATTTLTVP